jgi:hypothetical protein
MRAQLRVDDFTDLIGQRRQPAGWQLLAADFKQQLAVHYSPPPVAAT